MKRVSGFGALAVVAPAWAMVMGAAPAPSTAQADAAAVTFTHDIAPIVYAHCAPCHRPGEIGPFSLIAYADVRQHAAQIAEVTGRRLMPPWKPRRGADAFIGDRSLTAAQVDVIAKWVAGGAKEGDPSELPPAPAWPASPGGPGASGANGSWELGTPDSVVTMPVAYTVAADGPDVFRTFVLPIPASSARYVRAIEFRPGNTRVVHHANLGVDRTETSRRLDARDPGVGYAGGIMPDAFYPQGYMLGWTPGQRPRPSPDGMPWRLEGGSDLVVQLHLRPTGRPEPVQVSAAFYFTSTPPVRVPAGLRLGSQTIDVPAGNANHTIADSYVLPVDVDLLAVQPHAHNLARRVESTATLPDGTTRPLIVIDDWDFAWQDVYRYVAPIALPKGTTVSMRITYDNSAANPRNPAQPPRRTVWGQNTSDEMGDLWLQIVPARTADYGTLNDSIARKMLAQDLAGYTKLMEADPADPIRHETVAMLQLQAGHPEQAAAELRESLRLNPASAPARYNLGLALVAQQKFPEATAEFREAVRLDPDYADAHNNLGAMLHLNGQVEEAVAHYARTVALRPGNADAHNNLGRGLASIGRNREALDELSQASTLRPDWAMPLVAAALVRATTREAGIRDPAEAIRLADRAAVLTERRDPAVIDVLAVAYAAAGRFADAMGAARTAVDLATRAKSAALAAEIGRHLALFERGKTVDEK